jgi:histidinol-phosphate/aromatic aminotransferase/cobyric acid decarboxylase-like protein/GNAT superfamily N-acetyltransferase
MKTSLLEVPAPVAAVADTPRIRISLATDRERARIYELRHDVYARELGQHPCNDIGVLTDPLDAYNLYLVAWQDGEIAGFVSLTPPGRGRYSVEKYFLPDQLPFALDGSVYEIRLLTVVREKRRRKLAPLLMYAALRWVEAHGGSRVVAIGRREVLSLYRAAGLLSTGLQVQSGRVCYELLHAPVDAIRAAAGGFAKLLDELEQAVDWQLGFSFRRPAACFHGGAFFKAVGERFQNLERAPSIINADVLDAWFPPAPGVLEVLRDHLPWLIRTSPPADATGLVEAIAAARGVPANCVLPGAGSSDLIFLALRHWLRPGARVLILDPMYGEYAHLVEKVIRCRVDRFPLRREEDYDVCLSRFAAALAEPYDLVVLVNPNSPTGRHVPRARLEAFLRQAPPTTRFWIDETYVDFIGAAESLETFAAGSANVVICKSMSKAYGLSGARAAYLVASPVLLEELRSITPPWAVGLPGQVAAVYALADPEYYVGRYAETQELRTHLAAALTALGLQVVPGCANFLLAHLPAEGPTAEAVVTRCRERGLFLRDAGGMGRSLGRHALRIAVKDAPTNGRMIEILTDVLQSPTNSTN